MEPFDPFNVPYKVKYGFKCPHEWVEIEHYKIWASNRSGEEPPKGCAVMVVYGCTLGCGEERMEIIVEDDQ